MARLNVARGLAKWSRMGPIVLSACGLMLGLGACTSVKPVDLTVISQTNMKTVNTGLRGDRVLKPTKTFNIVAFYNGNERIEALAPYTDSEGQPLEECVGYSAQLRKGSFGRYRVVKLTRLVPATNAAPAGAVAPVPQTLADAEIAIKTSAAPAPKKGVAKTSTVPAPKKGAAKTSTVSAPKKGVAKTSTVSAPKKGAARTSVAPAPKKGAAKAAVSPAPKKAAPQSPVGQASKRAVNKATTAKERAL